MIYNSYSSKSQDILYLICNSRTSSQIIRIHLIPYLPTFFSVSPIILAVSTGARNFPAGFAVLWIENQDSLIFVIPFFWVHFGFSVSIYWCVWRKDSWIKGMLNRSPQHFSWWDRVTLSGTSSWRCVVCYCHAQCRMHLMILILWILSFMILHSTTRPGDARVDCTRLSSLLISPALKLPLLSWKAAVYGREGLISACSTSHQEYSQGRSSRDLR